MSDQIKMTSNERDDEDEYYLSSSEKGDQPLSGKNLNKFKEKHDKTGIVYVSRVPPHMRPHKMKTLLEQFGKVGRIYLAQEDEKKRKNRIRAGGTKKKQYMEGWVEFMDKRIAKIVALNLNGEPIGGKKSSFYHDDLWNLKYLPKFKWVHLKEQIAYERIARQKKMQVEMDQAKKEINMYMENVDKAKMIDAIEERKARKSGIEDGEDVGDKEQLKIRRKFRQRRAVDATEKESEKVAKVLTKLF